MVSRNTQNDASNYEFEKWKLTFKVRNGSRCWGTFRSSLMIPTTSLISHERVGRLRLLWDLVDFFNHVHLKAWKCVTWIEQWRCFSHLMRRTVGYIWYMDGGYKKKQWKLREKGNSNFEFFEIPTMVFCVKLGIFGSEQMRSIYRGSKWLMKVKNIGLGHGSM